MLKNLKIRTGLLAVLTLFVLALAGATSMGWVFARAADDAVDDLNRVATEQTRPLYETQVLLLRTRITLVAAYLDVEAGRGTQAQASVDQAGKFLADARQRYATFQRVPKVTEAARKLTADLDGIFNAYVRSIDALGEACLLYTSPSPRD